ncbi:hypothetical protein AB6735_04080 [Mucilaginibacter sp. RCC_168]|uniref:hypothetical protein n=1 Tax=Mucilaginibacter sp. RCC_168 TaxID=3239221 RepID=UPI003523FE5F
MATSQKKWQRAISFIALFFAIVGIGFVVKAEGNKTADSKGNSAVNNSNHHKKTVRKFTTEVWYYTPDTAPSGSAIYTSSNYTSTEPDNCGGATTVPCEISFTENANYSTLAQYLSYQQAHSLPVNIVSFKDL